MNFPGGPAGKIPSANAGDMDLIPIWGRVHMLQGNGTHVPPLPEPTCYNHWARTPRARALQQEEPPQWEACTPQLESS